MSEKQLAIEDITEQSVNNTNIVDREQFDVELQKYYSGLSTENKKTQWTSEKIQNVIKIIEEFNLAKLQKKRPSDTQYYHAKKYEIMNLGNEKVLILKKKSHSDPTVRIVTSTEYYQRIHDAHIKTSHGRRDKIINALKDKYVVPIWAINIFLQLCKICLSKKSFPKRGKVVKQNPRAIYAQPCVQDLYRTPRKQARDVLISEDFNRRGQIDLIDVQSLPDKEYKWLLQYQDHLTKFCFLRPLKSNQAKEVAIEVLKIFLEIGCPNILHSDNGREFTAAVLKEIVSLWPSCKIVNGRPRYLQSEGSIENSNQDVNNMIQAWMVDHNSTNWSIGCYFVQFQKNSSYHSTIARTPFKALFGDDPRLGLSSTNLSKNIISKLETEEDLVNCIGDTNKRNYNLQNLDTHTTHEQLQVTRNENENIINSNMLLNTYQSPVIKEEVDIFNSEINAPVVGNESIIPNNCDIVPNESTAIAEEPNILICYMCDQKTSETTRCQKCNNMIHTMCGVSIEDEGCSGKLICNLCANENSILRERKESHQNLKRAAEKMTAVSSKKFKDIDLGTTVLVEVPKLERQQDSKNMIGKVIEKRNELYTVATPFGMISDWIPRNSVPLSPKAILSGDIPEASESREDEDDVYTEVIYLEDEDPISIKKEPITPSEGKPTKRKKAEYDVEIEEVTKEVRKSELPKGQDDELEKFGSYIACLLRSMPKPICMKLQLDIVNKIMSEKLKLDEGSSLVDD